MLKEAGIGMFVTIGCSADHRRKAEELGMGWVRMPHNACDNVGLNLLLDKVELAHRLEGDALGKPHRHHLVGKQLQRPVCVAFGCSAARDGYQMRFLSAIQLALLSRSRTFIERTVESLLDTASWAAECDSLQLLRAYQAERQLGSV